jgi:hypothetical protein
MNADTLTSGFAINGGGFFGGLLLDYALKKVVGNSCNNRIIHCGISIFTIPTNSLC